MSHGRQIIPLASSQVQNYVPADHTTVRRGQWVMCHKKHIKKIYNFTHGGSRRELRIYEVGEHYFFYGCQQCENNNIPVNIPVVLLQEVHIIDIVEKFSLKAVKGVNDLTTVYWPDLINFFFQTVFILKYSFVLVSKYYRYILLFFF